MIQNLRIKVCGIVRLLNWAVNIEVSQGHEVRERSTKCGKRHQFLPSPVGQWNFGVRCLGYSSAISIGKWINIFRVGRTVQRELQIVNDLINLCVNRIRIPSLVLKGHEDFADYSCVLRRRGIRTRRPAAFLNLNFGWCKALFLSQVHEEQVLMHTNM